MLLFSKFFTRVRDRLGGYDVDEASRRFTDERIFEWYKEFRERLNSEIGTTPSTYVVQDSVAAGESLVISGGLVRITDVWLCDNAYTHTQRLEPTTYEELRSAGIDPAETGAPTRYYRKMYSESPYAGGGAAEQLVLYPVPDETVYLEVIGSSDDGYETLAFTDGELDSSCAAYYLGIPEVFLLAAVEHCAYLMAESAEEVPVDHVNRRMQIADKAYSDGKRKWVTQNGGKMQNPYYFPSSTGRVSWP